MKILLHGALGSATQFDAVQAKATANQHLYAFNLPGHGYWATNEPFTLQLFGDSVLHFLDEKKTAQADIFGYSMGGYVALWLAWKYPARVRSVTTYGTKFDWNPEVAAGMGKMFDPEKIESKAPQLAASLIKAHGWEQWKTLCHRTKAFLQDLGNSLGIPPEGFSEIQCPVTIGWGDLDNVVTLDESRRVASAIPQGRLEILPGGKHLMEQVELEQLCELIFKPNQ